MPDHQSRSSNKPKTSGFHGRDLRFAGGISAGLVSAILVAGALLAPVADWDGLTSTRANDETKTVTLANTPTLRVEAPGSETGQAGPLGAGSPSGGVVVAPAALDGTPGTLPGAGAGGGDLPVIPGVVLLPRTGAT